MNDKYERVNKQTNKSMNMNEWTWMNMNEHEWMNEQTDKRMKEQINEQMDVTFRTPVTELKGWGWGEGGSTFRKQHRTSDSSLRVNQPFNQSINQGCCAVFVLFCYFPEKASSSRRFLVAGQSNQSITIKRVFSCSYSSGFLYVLKQLMVWNLASPSSQNRHIVLGR